MSSREEYQEFLEALLALNRAATLRIARRALEVSASYLFDDVVRPAMESIGRLWQANRLTVAEEHAATALAQAAVSAQYPSFPWPARVGPRAVVSCVRGEEHGFGARMVADLLALDGWDAIYVGENCPTDDLAGLVVKSEARLVGLSVTVPMHIPAAMDVVALLRKRSPGTKILVGGQAVALLSDPLLELGADGTASSATEASVLVREWR